MKNLPQSKIETKISQRNHRMKLITHNNKGKSQETAQTFEGSQNQKNRSLRPLNKNYYLLKKYDAAQIYHHFNDQSCYNINYNMSDLQLVGNQFTHKPSPMPFNYQNLDQRLFLQENKQQPPNQHKELLQFLKQKYKEQQNSLLFNISKEEKKLDDSDTEYGNRYQSNVRDSFKADKILSLDKSLDSQENRLEPLSEAIEFQRNQHTKSIEQAKHRKLLSQFMQKNSQAPTTAVLTPLKKQSSIQNRLNSRQKGPSSTIPPQKDNQNESQKLNQSLAKDELEQIQEINKARKSAGINQRLKPKKNQNNSAQLLLHQANLQENEKIEKFYKLQKEIKAKYNDISISQRQLLKEEPYKYILIRGNNSELVKRCLDDRNGEWQEIPASNTLYNFKWVPFSRGIRFDYLTTHGQKKMVNHFEGQSQISQKDTLFFNLQKFCESQRENVFDILPLTFIVKLGNQQSQYELDKFYSLFNILEKNKQSTNPQTLNNQISNQPLLAINKYTKVQIVSSMFSGHNFWLVKPPDFNRGRGVQVFSTLDQLKKIIADYQQGIELTLGQDKGTVIKSNQEAQIEKQNSSIPPEQQLKNFTNLDNVLNILKTDQFVIQKYLERPLLIQGRKFDIRLWVLISYDHKCYLFNEGYIRTSSQEFDLSPESVEKPFIHLTNNAVQRYNDNYGMHEEGNQLSFEKASLLLKQSGADTDFYQIIREQIEPIIVKSLKSVEFKLNPQLRKYSMEIFGYDFILDEDQKAWLIEVNTNPCLEESSGLLKYLVPRMIDDSLKLTLDLIFPPKRQKINKKPKDLNQSQVKEELDETYQSLHLASAPGIGSKEGELAMHYKKKVPSVKVEQNCLSSKESQRNFQEEELITLNKDGKQQNPSKYHVEGYSDFENMWRLIYQLKI